MAAQVRSESNPSLSSSQLDIIWPVNGTLLCSFLSGHPSRCHEQPQHWSLHKQGSKMKKQRESQCTQKTISLLSPLGTIQVSGCENGVHTIQILMDVAPAERSSEAPLSCVVNDSPAETSPELQRCVEWLQAYFSEPQTAGSLPLPAFHHPALQGDAFSSRVLQVLQRDVKFGETVSYKRLAEMAGNPKAARAVGGAMRKNPVPLLVPCHRVISSSGQSGPYMSGKGDHLKQWLLTHESQGGEG
ncbi:methylated-DNA--protein-cysteine methyltransferase isoform X1 [Acanthochromis polyacanthus]|uniref:methylated-DNA--protein-cysteine methyltransferase isoform X1 n=1 Tax=Acanthochromis polyacanthus TaxID=80966 RepID=UPI00223456F9|nr:methylated-DNA--protein-cysteine methyltransferase isoform X1 [Acanthochromis polyacanthus]